MLISTLALSQSDAFYFTNELLIELFAGPSWKSARSDCFLFRAVKIICASFMT